MTILPLGQLREKEDVSVARISQGDVGKTAEGAICEILSKLPASIEIQANIVFIQQVSK